MNRKFVIIGIIAGIMVFGIGVFLIFKSMSSLGPTTSANLQFWGVYDSPEYYADIISEYQKTNPGVKIAYRRFNYEDYETSLIDAFASGTGPDIWLMHNTWLPKHGDKIASLTQTAIDSDESLMTIQDFQNQFVDVAKTDLVYKSQIYGLPLYIDTLALYYNKDIFNSVGITSPPATWDEFNQSVKLLTSFDTKGRVDRSGAAMGTAKNINRSTDILMLLMIQSGVQMTNAENTSATFSENVGNKNVGETALLYYTDFANPNKETYTWDDQQHYSINAFIEGKTAMMLNYSHQILAIRAQAPRFNFGIVAAPQIENALTKVNFANYWAATVSKQSKNQLAAWKFLVYLTNKQNSTKYLEASSRPAARRDVISSQQQDLEMGVFAKQALSARSWYQVDNVAIEKIFAGMIDDVNYSRASIRDAIQSAESKVNVLMQKNR